MIRLKNKGWQLQLTSFILPIISIIILFTIMSISPFGNKNLMVSDLGTQYAPFLTQFKKIVAGNFSSVFYSFSNGLGDNMLPLIAYYLVSPFNFLLFFFEQSQLPIAVTCIIILKIGTIGTSMTYYLRKTFGQDKLSILLFSLVFSTSGFVTIYFYNLMWLDALIWLPLVTLGIQKIIQGKKHWLYQFSLCAAILTNYYLGYMICIFSVCYFVYFILREKKFVSISRFLTENRKIFLTFAGSSLLSGAMTGLILIPTVFGMLETGKSAVALEIFLPYPQFGLEFFSQIALGGMNFSSRHGHLPAIFVGSFVSVLFVYFFFSNQVSKKQKWSVGLFSLVLFLSLFIKSIYSVWHMFQETAGFPYRNTFVFSFFIIVIAYEAFLKIQTFEWRLLLRSAIFVGASILIGYWINNNLAIGNIPMLSWSNAWLSVVFLCLTSLLLFVGLHQKKSIYFLLLGVILPVEMMMNLYQTMKEVPYGNQQAFTKYVNHYQQAVDWAKKQDASFYRIGDLITSQEGSYGERYNGYNDSFLYGYHGVSSYSSTLRDELRVTLKEMGLFSKNERRIGYSGSTKLTDLLLDTRYIFSNYDTGNSAEKFGDIWVIENYSVVGLGFAIPGKEKLSILHGKNPFDVQNNIFQQLTNTNKYLFYPAKILEDAATSLNDTKLHEYVIETTRKGEVYTFLPRSVESISVNGNLLDVKIEPGGHLVSLGSFPSGTKLSLQLTGTKKLSLSEKDFQIFDTEGFEATTNIFASNSFQLTDWADGRIKGHIAVSEDSLLYLGIPFDDAWHILVNGEKIIPEKAFGAFIGIPLPKGTHQITLHYVPKGLVLGVAVSGVAIVLSIAWFFIQKKTKHDKS